MLNLQKCAIIGCGNVGATCAYTLMHSGILSEIVLIDANTKKAEGEAMDLNHALPFLAPMKIYAGCYEDLYDCGIIIIAAGAGQAPGETRLDLLQKNKAILSAIVGGIRPVNTEAILLLVSNPVDILTYITLDLSGFDPRRVIGSGTVLDTARLKFLVGQKLGAEKFCEYFEAFGFTEKTGIDLPAETMPVAGVNYHTLDTMGIVELSSSSFGQSFQVTPIQMITAISAIANGGKLMTPYVVAKQLDENGNVVSETQPNVRRQVISKQTANIVAGMMEQVVTSGTGKNAYVAGYRVAGKTGTSQKLNNVGHYVASFGCFAPADDPEIAVLIIVDDPVGQINGGQICTPVAAQVVEKSLEYMGVEREYTDSEMKLLDTNAPNLVGSTVGDAKALLEQAVHLAFAPALLIVAEGGEHTRPAVCAVGLLVEGLLCLDDAVELLVCDHDVVRLGLDPDASLWDEDLVEHLLAEALRRVAVGREVERPAAVCSAVVVLAAKALDVGGDVFLADDDVSHLSGHGDLLRQAQAAAQAQRRHRERDNTRDGGGKARYVAAGAHRLAGSGPRRRRRRGRL